MQVNFSPDEYNKLLMLAHAEGTLPAPLVHKWVIERAELDLFLLERRHGMVSGHGMAEMPSDAQMPCDPNDERSRG
jgi:hypothetical protein